MAFLIDGSARPASASVEVRVTNLSDDCDLFVPIAPPVACGDPDGTLYDYSASAGVIGLGDEFHTWSDAEMTLWGDQIPVWVYHYDPAATATFDVVVTCTAPAACTTVTCGTTTPGGTGNGTGGAPPTVFTPGPTGDSEPFLLDATGRPAGGTVRVDIANVTSDVDLFVPVLGPPLTCGDPAAASFTYSSSGGLIGILDEFHTFDDATLTLWGDQIPIWVYNFDPNPSTYDVVITCNPPGVGCGDCASPTVLTPTVTGTPGSQTALDVLMLDTSLCTTDNHVPTCVTGGFDEIVEFVAPFDGTCTADTCGAGTTYDTALAALDGSCTGAELICNDDSCATQSMISFPITSGYTYILVVDSYNGGTGPVELTVNMTEGGGGSFYTCAAPGDLTTLGVPVTGTTVGAPDDVTLDDLCMPYMTLGGPDQIYTFTPAGGTYDITLCNSGYDTSLEVHDGSCTGPIVGCDDDTCQPGGPLFQSVITGLSLSAGTTYYIVVDGYNGTTGTYELDITPFP
jgi:hypothetical protein